ncbi:hypothetical protein Tsubulata_046533 [Turnera subulata]|uniref:Conserved oligomeric Golgi complex subunit 1 n=1 Tax=Turnera subulata TaxID=218843 RepID=A0A9Q0G348_9ROSI|nr:hypothetical protein Tsubulata_046533 [Turnera subulata]
MFNKSPTTKYNRPKTATTDDRVATLSGGGYGDAESLIRTKPISEIRTVESSARKQIDEKREQLRQLVGNRYRDLIDSADSIVNLKILLRVHFQQHFLHPRQHPLPLHLSCIENPKEIHEPRPGPGLNLRDDCRINYLVDMPEQIYGCLDESMFLEAAGIT